jgi:hypothetical protein
MPIISTSLWKLWLTYVAVGTTIAVVWFGIMEGIAWCNRIDGDTLSEFVWAAHVPAVIFFMGMGFIIVGSLWLMLHFASGGKWGI